MSNTNFFIPVGGEGMRLRPLTEATPKPLLPVARDGRGYERIIDTPIRIAAELGRRTVVASYFEADQIKEYFEGTSVNVTTDTDILHIGGSMIQHSEKLFQGDPDYVVMVPGDHYVPQNAVDRLVQKLEKTNADVALLGTWDHAYHEVYEVTSMQQDGSDALVYGIGDSKPRQSIASLGTYAFSAAWLQKRLPQAPASAIGHCDLTTDLVFGKDQDRAPYLIFEPLYAGEYWQDVGTIRRLYDHIRYLHQGGEDTNGNIFLGDTYVEAVADSVVYVGATQPISPQRSSFIAKDFTESYN